MKTEVEILATALHTSSVQGQGRFILSQGCSKETIDIEHILDYAGDNMVLENIIGETSDSTGMDTEDHIRSTKSVTVHDDVIILDNTDVYIASGKMSNTGLEIVDDIIDSADTKMNSQNQTCQLMVLWT